jgi:radical SAM protein with 4Fe4S-binding SPASM domain
VGSLRFAANLLTGKRSFADARRALEYRAHMKKRLVHIELTSKCNTCCAACYRSGSMKEYMDTSTTMSVEQAEKLLKLYQPDEVRGFALSGGENLLHPDFFTIVQMMRDRFPEAEIQLFSNGIVLARDPGIMSRLLASPVDSIQFSLHGARPETVARLMPGVKLEETLRVVTEVVENSNINVSVNFVIQESNIDEMQEFVDLIATTPVRSIVLTPMNFAGHFEEPFDYESYWARIGLREKWNAAAEKARALGIEVTPLRDLCGCLGPIDVLTADGSMVLCWGNYLVKKYAVGNVFVDNPKTIRNRREFAELRRALKAGETPEMCSACWIQGYDL